MQLIRSIKIVILGALLAISSNVIAADDCHLDRDVKAGSYNESEYKRMEKIYKIIGDEKYNEAADALNQMLKRTSNNAYVKAIAYQLLAQVEWSRERYPSALKNFEKAVELDALPDQIHYALMYQIAQLYYMDKRYDEALVRLDMWFCAVPEADINPLAYVLKASIHIADNNYREALSAINKAIASSDDPKKSWYEVKLASHYELKQFPEAAKTLETMISRWPNNKQYWIQLSSIYVKLKQDKKGLAVLSLAYSNGLLDKKSDLLQLISLNQYLDIPYKAAVILEKGMADGLIEKNERTLTQLGDTWYQAEELEKALVAFGEASKLANDGKIDLRRGYLLADTEQWAESGIAMGNAIKKGGIKEREMGEAWLLKGMAEFNTGKYKAARESFGNATRYKKTTKAAQQWIKHMNEQN
ncbi:MAG: tetratricopeptide repeat protein [Proteobacteria bacterium]|nr:tetratricopeptide repeat protein [Pseudomonadota bacterium]